MATITSKNEKIRREAEKEAMLFYYTEVAPTKATFDDVAEWLGISRTAVSKMFHSGNIKYRQVQVIRKHLRMMEV